MQSGSIKKHGKWWVVRYYEIVLANGKEHRKQMQAKLAPIGPAYPEKRDVEHLAHAILAPINGKTHRPTSVDTVLNFLEHTYLENCKTTLRPSTAHGYSVCFNQLKPFIPEKTELRDVRTSDVEKWLRDLAGSKELAHTSLRNCKNFLSGAFRFAKRTDAVTTNPCRDA